MTLRWGVVGTMDEPAPLILAWVAHHLSIGAAEAHVYLDRPNDEVTQALAGIEGVFVTTCDDAHWAQSARGRKPKRVTGRQMVNADEVYRTRPLDWLLHCDADEFFWPKGDFLADLKAAEARNLRLRNVERVHRGAAESIFSGTFRGWQSDPDLSVEVYGRWAPFLRTGFSGYRAGKDIVRTGEDLKMGIHFPTDLATGKLCSAKPVRLFSALLLHFDGLTPLHSALKLLNRAFDPAYQAKTHNLGVQRDRQLRFARNHATKPRQFQQMLEGVFALTDAQAAALGKTHFDIAFDPSPALAALGIKADLSVERFDAELRKRAAELIETSGLAL